MDYVLVRARQILLMNPETNELYVRLRNLKDVDWTNDGQVNYATTNGVAIASVKSQKESMIETANATISEGLLALQTGTDMEVVTNSTEYEHTDAKIVLTSDTGATEFTAIGAVGSEIKFLYLLDANGNVTSTLTQGATASATEFAYDSGTKAITTSGVADATNAMAIYNVTSPIANKFINDAFKFSGNVKMVLDGLFQVACGSGDIYVGQLIYEKGELQEGYSFNIPEVGDPSVHSLGVKALKPCFNDNLWTLNIVNEANLI